MKADACSNCGWLEKGVSDKLCREHLDARTKNLSERSQVTSLSDMQDGDEFDQKQERKNFFPLGL